MQRGLLHDKSCDLSRHGRDRGESNSRGCLEKVLDAAFGNGVSVASSRRFLNGDELSC